MSTTIHDLTREMVRDHTEAWRLRDNSEQKPVFVADGLRPRKPPTVEGLHTFTPEQLLNLRVDHLELNGTLKGYQREVDNRHARRMAESMLLGKPFPLVTVALDGHGRHYIVDGQHRAIAGVIARTPVHGVIRRMTKEEQAELFTLQSRAKRLDRNVLVMSGSGPFELYVQDALVNNDNPWHDIVSANRRSKTRIAPYTMYQLLIRYVGNTEAQAASSHGGKMDERWDRGLADEMAPLIRCFGNKQTNPLAFKPTNVQAIGATAMWVFRRGVPHVDNAQRWVTHMPTFHFAEWAHVNTQIAMTGELVRHWNKRLSSARRIMRGT